MYWFLYRVVVGGREVRVGITQDPRRREREHRRRWLGARLIVEKRVFGEQEALAWEAVQRRAGRPTGP